MNNLHDIRDRTAEFFQTVAALQQHSASTDTATTASNGLHHSRSNQSFGSRHGHSQSQALGLSHSYSSPDEFKDTTPLLSQSSPGSATSTGLTADSSQSSFNSAAKLIGQNIKLLTSNLDRLSRLVHQKSLFADPTNEIDDLTHTVKTQLRSIEEDLSALDTFVRTNLDRARHADSSNAHMKNHSTVIVQSLKSNLGASTKNFIALLETRTKNLKQQNSRRKEFEHASSTATQSVELRQRGNLRFDSLLHDTDGATAADNEPATMDDEPTIHSLQAQSLVFESTSQDSYHQSRAEAVETIESTIHELGSMYQRLTSLIAMQDETIGRIDTSLDETQLNIDRGHNELLKYFDNISSNRMLILKVFAILIAFLTFFMIFVA